MTIPTNTGNTIVIIIVIIALVVIGGLLLAGSDQNNGSEEQFAEQVDYTITGIEPGAGIMANTETAMETYGLTEAGWTLQESSEAAMLTELEDAIADRDAIVVTVWEPHAAFSISTTTSLRKLEDPQNIYNDPEATRTFLEEHAPDYADADVQSDVLASVVYQGFAEDAPKAYEFFQNFEIPASTQSNWIYDLNIEEMEPDTIAEEWVSANQETVDSWKPSDDTERGKDTIRIGIPPWSGAKVKSRVVARALEQIGYETEVNELDAGVVYTSLAEGDLDVTVAGWLPTTHANYWDELGEDLEIAGVNVTLTWLGLGVPDYADENIQTIADLAVDTSTTTSTTGTTTDPE